MAVNIPADIYNFLENALNKELKYFEVKQHQGNEKGQGFLGEVFFISLKNKKTGEDHHLVVKQVLSCAEESSVTLMSSSYTNEIYFYTKVVPSLIAFQKRYPGVEVFNNIPKCLGVSSEKGKEKIAFENLKFKNYEMHPKKIPLDSKMYEAIFKLYGKYHGLSYAFKNYQPEKFLELGSAFQNNFVKFVDQGLMVKAIEGVCIKMKTFLEEEGEVNISEKFKKYVDNGVQLFVKALSYKSPYSVLLHGDCWSNNMMFKFNKSREVEDIKLLDFQMSMLGSPIVDLTYTFYSGASKKSLDNLSHFLKIYYNSLGDTLKQYDCDVAESLPYEALKKEWKEHSAFGFIMGLLVWMTKNADPTEVPDITEIMDGDVDSGDALMNMAKNDDGSFKKCSLDLLRHLYENNFL